MSNLISEQLASASGAERPPTDPLSGGVKACLRVEKACDERSRQMREAGEAGDAYAAVSHYVRALRQQAEQDAGSAFAKASGLLRALDLLRQALGERAKSQYVSAAQRDAYASAEKELVNALQTLRQQG